jgi:hypothetical protein
MSKLDFKDHALYVNRDEQWVTIRSDSTGPDRFYFYLRMILPHLGGSDIQKILLKDVNDASQLWRVFKTERAFATCFYVYEIDTFYFFYTILDANNFLIELNELYQNYQAVANVYVVTFDDKQKKIFFKQSDVCCNAPKSSRSGFENRIESWRDDENQINFI